MKGYPLKKKIIIHVRGEKISIQQKMTKIRTFENKGPNLVIQKFIVICWLKILLIFFQSIFFFHHVSYIEFEYKILKCNHNKKCIWMIMQSPDYNPYIHFLSPLLYDWCMFIKFHLLINIFIQVGNLNP